MHKKETQINEIESKKKRTNRKLKKKDKNQTLKKIRFYFVRNELLSQLFTLFKSKMASCKQVTFAGHKQERLKLLQRH